MTEPERLLPPWDLEAAADALAAADPAMARLIVLAGPPALTLRPVVSPFASLFRAIVYQQLSGKAAGTIHGRVLALFDGHATPEGILALPDEALRGAGLSRAKTAAAQDLAQKALDGTVPPLDALHAMPDDEAVRRLSAVRGVGPWTVQMFLMFGLGRPDVWPVADLGVQAGYAHAFGLDELPKPRALDALGEPFRPWRSLAAWYCWRAVDLHRAGQL